MWFGGRRGRARQVARAMAAARHCAEGAYITEWRFSAASPAHPDEAIESILSWCRETLGSSRRPWGIDGFDLAIAVGGEMCAAQSLSLRQLRPADLYQPLAAEADAGDAATGHSEALERLRNFVRTHLQVGAVPAATSIAVALFAWGDAAHASLPSTL